MQHVRSKYALPVALQACLGFLILTLVMFGAAATVLKLLGPGGWLATLFGAGFGALGASLAAIVVVGAIAWVSNAWLLHVFQRRASDLILVSFGAAGALYLGQLLFGGSG